MELQERLLSLQKELSTPRQIAFYRIQLLEEEGEEDVNNDGQQQQQQQGGLASMLVPLLKDSLSAWLELTLTLTQTLPGKKEKPIILSANALLSKRIETMNLLLVLMLHLQVTKMNPSLGEELGRQGSHAHLVKLMNLDLAKYISGNPNDTDGDDQIDVNVDEANQDTVIELQDLACEIAALACSFPVKYAPFCTHGLRQRLPLIFSIGAVVSVSENSKTGGTGRGDGYEYEKQSMVAAGAEETVLIHQVTIRQTAQEDVGFGT
jgi:hypothetical protein